MDISKGKKEISLKLISFSDIITYLVNFALPKCTNLRLIQKYVEILQGISLNRKII